MKCSARIAAVTLAAAFGVAGSAAALPLFPESIITAGDFRISFDNYDSATTGYGTTLGTVCTTVAGCDAAATSAAVGSVGSVNPSADTMGIVTITNISRISDGTSLYNLGQDGIFLTGVFGGLMDYNVSNATLLTGVTTFTQSVGGQFAVYENPTNYNPANGAFVTGTTDLNVPKYPGITGGTLWLSGIFSPGVVFGSPTTTYASQYNSLTLAGNGQGYLDVTGGLMATTFNTNSQIDPNGGAHDLFLSTVFDAASTVDTANGWTVTSTGQIKGRATSVPEPSSLALLGIGLLGFGAAVRKRKQPNA